MPQERINGNRVVPGIYCPKCDHPVVYNGNYFCSQWSYPYDGVYGCDWALSHGEDGEPTNRADRKLWKDIQATHWFKDAMRRRSSR